MKAVGNYLMEWSGMDRIELAEDKDRWRSLVNKQSCSVYTTVGYTSRAQLNEFGAS
jgi:hypothetical protein